MVMKCLLILIVVIAVCCDIKWRRIPNVLVFSGLIIGLIFQYFTGGWPLIFEAVKGLGIGVGLLFIPFLLGGMGAGDVKLLGLVGALQGPVFVFNTFIWMALWGGLIAVIYMIINGRLQLWLGRLIAVFYTPWQYKMALLKDKSPEVKVTIPYGVAIGLGVISTIIWSWW